MVDFFVALFFFFCVLHVCKGDGNCPSRRCFLSRQIHHFQQILHFLANLHFFGNSYFLEIEILYFLDVHHFQERNSSLSSQFFTFWKFITSRRGIIFPANSLLPGNFLHSFGLARQQCQDFREGSRQRYT